MDASDCVVGKDPFIFGPGLALPLQPWLVRAGL